MNSKVHPVIVVLVLALTAIAIGIWTWGSGAAAQFGGPAEIKLDRNGHVFVQIQNFLIEHDETGAFVKTHDLSGLGVVLFLGSFDFFANGDVLLRRGPDPRSFSDNIRAFQRKTNKDSIVPSDADSGLFRCDLESRTCTRFGDAGVDFKAAHGLFIDRETDEIYVSDTTRHVLRKYSADGDELVSAVGGFRFPNQLLVHDGLLYVADTNHHVVRVVDPTTTSFGLDLHRADVVPSLANSSGQIWPSHTAVVGDHWWVNNMRQGMNEGGIYLFDEDWQFLKKLDLPDEADPISILPVGDEVWVSDWNNDKVHRFSASGAPMASLKSAGLEAVLEKSRGDRRRFEMAGYAGVVLFLFVLGGLAVRAFATR